MCEPKPGNRCASHATEALKKKKTALGEFLKSKGVEKHRDVPEIFRAQADDLYIQVIRAQQDYDSTATGLEELRVKAESLSTSKEDIDKRCDAVIQYNNAQELHNRRAAALRVRNLAYTRADAKYAETREEDIRSAVESVKNMEGDFSVNAFAAAQEYMAAYSAWAEKEKIQMNNLNNSNYGSATGTKLTTAKVNASRSLRLSSVMNAIQMNLDNGFRYDKGLSRIK